MIKNHTAAILASALTAILVAGSAQADSYSPWTMADEASELSLRFSAQTADRFFAGNAEMNLPADLEQDSYTLDYAYGISDQLSLDLRIGYTQSDFITAPGLAPNGGLSGFSDSRIGLRYNFMGAENNLPTVTVGIAGLIKGNYDVGALPAVGDGASGFEVSALVGHAFDSGLILSGALARRQYNGRVPEENVFNIGAGFAVLETASLGMFYQDVSSNGKLDIGGPGFSPSRFPEVDEEYSLFGLGGNVVLSDAFSLGLDFGRKNDGKNTAKSRFVSASVGYFF